MDIIKGNNCRLHAAVLQSAAVYNSKIYVFVMLHCSCDLFEVFLKCLNHCHCPVQTKLLPIPQSFDLRSDNQKSKQEKCEQGTCDILCIKVYIILLFRE